MDRAIKRRKRLCNHDISSPDNTLIKVRTRKMIYPAKEDYYCLYCKCFFTYQKDGEGELSPVKD